MENSEDIIKKDYIKFERFISDVLHRRAVESGKEILFDHISKTSHTLQEFDAICPNGFENISGIVIFEFKSRSTTADAIEKFIKRVSNNYKPSEKKTIVFIVNGKVVNRDRVEESVIIWDEYELSQWYEKYPIEYCNAYSYDSKLVSKEKHSFIGNEEYRRLNDSYISILSNARKRKLPLALVLGTGVSIEQGAKNWNDLLDALMKKTEIVGLADEAEKLVSKVGGGSLISAQLCLDIFKDENDFLWEVHNQIYGGSFSYIPGSELEAIARLAKRYCENKNFRILTYNYDDYLERYLDKEKVPNTILYSEKEGYYKDKRKTEIFEMKGKVTEEIGVYHVHGFLRNAKNKTSLRGSVCLTEADYNILYNQPYSWPITSQMSFFRENVCLFVGCSLIDPNIRRLLEIAHRDGHYHYAILKKDNLTSKDLSQATAHFYRMGIKVIWIDDFNEIPKILDCI